MPASITTLWVGSHPSMPSQDLSINPGGGAVPQTIDAGPYYVRHGTASLSAMEALRAALVAAGVTGPVVVELLQDLHVRITGAGDFTITWTDTELRDLLGFTGGTTSSAGGVATASLRSQYLWSAGWPGRLATPSGRSAYNEEDAVVRPTADGLDQEIDHFVTHGLQEIDYDVVPLARYMQADTAIADGLVWDRFRTRVLLGNGRFQLYETIVEDFASTDPIVWGNPLGPYLVRELPPGINSRKIPLANTYWRVEAKLRQVAEYS
jgi:hypothetical protein